MEHFDKVIVKIATLRVGICFMKQTDDNKITSV